MLLISTAYAGVIALMTNLIPITFIKKLLTSKNIDNSPVLTKPDHKLTIEEKRKIVEYELDLEEKNQTLLASISSNGS